jgi:pimeloyl-ACP methyl ester carboxylesterase
VKEETNETIRDEIIAGLHVIHVVPGNKRFIHPFVFIHGMMSDAAMFIVVMRWLAKLGFESYSIDLPGHGKSDIGEGRSLKSASMDDYIVAVEQFLKTMSARVIIAGHSMGAVIGAQLAAGIYRHNIAGFVSLMSGPPRGVTLGPETMKRMPKYLPCMAPWNYRTIMLTKKDAREIAFNRLTDEQFKDAFPRLQAESGKVGLEITVMKYGMKRLDCPVLVIKGAHDLMAPNQERISRKLGGKLVTVNCCHMFMFDSNANEVVTEIFKWVSMNPKFSNAR